ncbi:MAG: transcriptional repressor [Rickettsiales bacterium]|nr:transcriptional repressor [Rickettsiales bacterium]MBV31083.1 transcriptional repressor [Rickettsiales bacterium]MEC7834910.1 Fur family transcriptional regulator [Pseudomonadota bacterium]
MRPYASIIKKLKSFNLRPTKQRLIIGKIIFSKGDHHFTIDDVYKEARILNASISLATIYNTLKQFRHYKMIRELSIGSGKSYYDTNTKPHHHFLFEKGKLLKDIPYEGIEIKTLPKPPKGMEINDVEVLVKIKNKK